jgi:SAM-dependent methyltransferase
MTTIEKPLFLHPLAQIIFFNPIMNYNVWSLRQFVKNAAKTIPAKSKIVDIGAGECQYKPLFSHTQYVSTDWCGTSDHHQYSAGIDYPCPADDMPFDDNTFDYALCTQVLEHVRYPERVIKEICRVLKPGGILFLTVPQTWEEHEQPYDYHRFTQFALHSYGEENGFIIKQIKPEGGRFMALGHFLAWTIPTLFRDWFGRKAYLFSLVLFYPLNFVIALVFFLLDPLDRKKEMTMNYDCIFQKK